MCNICTMKNGSFTLKSRRFALKVTLFSGCRLDVKVRLLETHAGLFS